MAQSPELNQPPNRVPGNTSPQRGRAARRAEQAHLAAGGTSLFDDDIVPPVDGMVEGAFEEGAQEAPEQEDLEDESSDNVYELHVARQTELLNRQGFLASSSTELNHAYKISSKDWGIGGAAKYLAVISQHQTYGKRKDGEKIDIEDPAATARSIANEFGRYAQNARGEVQAMLSLRGFMGRYDELDADAPLTAIQPVKEWLQEDWMRRGLTDLLKYTETLELLNGGEDHTNDSYTSKDTEFQQRLEVFVDALTVIQAAELVAARYAQQSERFSFWKTQLHVAHNYSQGRLKAVLAAQLAKIGEDPDN